MELSGEQINQLEQELKTCIQQSLTTYIPVSLINKGALQGYSVWVDKWPDFTAVVVKADRSVIKVPYIHRKAFIYCREKDAGLFSLLTDVLEWKETIELCGVSEDVAAICNDVFDNTVSELCQLHNNISVTETLYVECYLLIVTEKTLENIKKPENMIEDCIRLDIVETVSNAWKLNDDGSYEYIRFLIRMNQPSVCLYTQDGKPVAWAIEHIYGTNGILYVQPEYRRRGLAQYTQYALSKKIIKRDGCAFVVVKTDNVASLNLHEKIGFRKVYDSVLTFTKYTLHMSNHSSMNDLIE